MEKQSLKEIVYNETLKSIIKADYKPGQILNEQELINKFGYSKSPIREALIMLCNDGVLRNIPRYGYEVVRLTKQDVDDIMKFRRILEAGCMREYGASLSAKQIEALRELHSNEKPADDVWDQWNANEEFHMKMISFSDNEFATRQLGYAMNIMKRAYAQYFWDKWEGPSTQVVDLHGAIIDALEKGDVDEAVSNLLKDLGDLRL